MLCLPVRIALLLEQREGGTVLGTQFRGVHDFLAQAIDWRGTYKNAGA